MHAPEPMPMTSTEALLARMMGDVQICREIVEIGLREARESAAVVESLRTTGELDATRRALHSLRGSAAIFAADSFAEILRRMETDCQEGRTDAVLAALEPFALEMARYENSLTALARDLDRMP